MDLCRLPNGTQNLAWLSLDQAEGREYWQAMNLAGDYAKACHDVIHQKLAKVLNIKPLLTIENHHNFAWKERQADGRELIVHRKGAVITSYSIHYTKLYDQVPVFYILPNNSAPFP